ncbi:hypothetical protein HPB49_023981 [Dermacentor silvarum]|uniref:Uncharacterized protein n=1 Tax=Dermacentor silvarum TaxID=543639 RepID=A0ACB8D0Y2_DERSI|nr:hypothetical protein HPB49_023981 [Dermacentor silvarum]
MGLCYLGVPPSRRVSECNRDDASEYILIVQTQSSLVACEGVTVVPGTKQVTVSAVGRDCQPYSGVSAFRNSRQRFNCPRERLDHFGGVMQQRLCACSKGSRWRVSGAIEQG